MFRVVSVAEAALGHGGFSLHQRIIYGIVDNCHAAPDARLSIHEAPGEEANGHALVDQQVEIATDAFGVNDAIRENLDRKSVV